ncbi:MAG: hypothetical protein Q9P14_09980 [candidate division KSB1 bacterium]|nr:hypothetical protein [candidate division KSB1 bacterium]MDQ7063587.1 hypothetical protein [candidate division KSB1 bacterium]
MKVVVDENISYGVAQYLKGLGYDVIAIADAKHSACQTLTFLNWQRKKK